MIKKQIFVVIACAFLLSGCSRYITGVDDGNKEQWKAVLKGGDFTSGAVLLENISKNVTCEGFYFGLNKNQRTNTDKNSTVATMTDIFVKGKCQDGKVIHLELKYPNGKKITDGVAIDQYGNKYSFRGVKKSEFKKVQNAL